MTKKHFITITAGVAILSCSLAACGVRPTTGTSTSNNNYNRSQEAQTEVPDNDDVYYEIEEYNRSAIITAPEDYEPGGGKRTGEVYVAVGDYVLNAFGMTFQEIDEWSNYNDAVTQTLDNSPGRYCVEYWNHRNCYYLFHKTGSEYWGSSDPCVGAKGWLERIMDIDRDGPVTIREFNNALRETYPDCTDVRFTSTSSIADAPKGIRDTLAYMDFTVSFYNTAPTKVRLYINEPREDSYISNDDWVMLCLPDEYA